MTSAVRAGLRVVHPSESAPPEPAADTEYRRVFAFLEAIRAVVEERACLTEEGFLYLGLPFAFTQGGLR